MPVTETKAQRVERLKRELNPWEAYAEIQRFAREGWEAIPPEWLGTYFRWWGLYTQGDGVGAIGGKGGEGKATRHFMVRIRIPNGQLQAHQLRTIAGLAERYARGIADITVRQNIQLHWVTLESLPDVFQTLWRTGITTMGACGDVTRNVTGCPLAGLDADEIVDASPLVHAATRMLNGNPMFYNLPRKYKVSVTGCRAWCSYPEVNDVGFTALRHPATAEIGFVVRVGGGLSTDPRLATRLDAFVRWHEALPVLRAISEIFRDSDVLRQSREKARLKFLFLQHGWTAEKFLAAIEDRLGRALEHGVPDDPPEDVYRDHVGLHRQKQEGLVYAGVAVLRGRLTPAEMRAAADLAERYGTGEIRTTNMQNLLIPNVQRDREGARAVALDVRDQEVLHVGRPDFAGPVALRQVRGRAHLGGSQPTAQHRDARVDQPLLLLAMEPHVVAVDVLWRVVGHAVLEGPAKPVLDRREELLGGPAVLEEEELEPGLLAALPQHVRVAEDLRDRPEDRQRLVPAHEGVESRGEARIGREPAADAHGEADLARRRVVERRQPDVVDLRVRAPYPAAGDRDLVLARQVIEGRVAVDHARRRVDERRGVHDLVGVHAGERAAGDVARDVAARALCRDPAAPQRLEDVGQVLERHPVKLDVLADRDVGNPPRVALGEPGDRAELVRLQLTVRNPDADHEVACRLTLTALAADRADAVALGVDTPPAKVRSEPLRGNRVPALAREALDFGVRLPGVQLALEPLDTLGLRLGPGHRATKYLLSIGFVKSPSSPARCPSGAPRDTFPALPF